MDVLKCVYLYSSDVTSSCSSRGSKRDFNHSHKDWMIKAANPPFMYIERSILHVPGIHALHYHLEALHREKLWKWLCLQPLGGYIPAMPVIKMIKSALWWMCFIHSIVISKSLWEGTLRFWIWGAIINDLTAFLFTLFGKLINIWMGFYLEVWTHNFITNH